MLLGLGGDTLQIDTGGAPFGSGSFDVGARVLMPALWTRGVRSLGTLLITHGDPDHLGGAAAVVDAFAPGRLWEGIDVPRHAPMRELRDRVIASGSRVETRRAGDLVEWRGARIRVLHPPAPDWERPRVRNDDSVVLEIVYGDVAILLTGDISAEVERDLASRLTSAPIRILKVAHHGSRTSTSHTQLNAWRPQYALISAGRGNTFGHPTLDVIRRLEAIGAAIFRTDLHGQITLETDGRRVDVGTYVSRAAARSAQRGRRSQRGFNTEITEITEDGAH
jgi:competence protein ComEC